MENASKALIIAGGVLVAILLISLIVAFRGQLSEFMGAKDNVQEFEQVSEFNKQFDVYYRDKVYGSEILSLVNKVNDYNKKYSATGDYIPLNIQINLKKTLKVVVDNKETEIFNSKITYTEGFNSTTKKYITGISTKVKLMEDKENNAAKIKTYTTSDNKKIQSSIASLSGYRDNEINQLFKGSTLTSLKNSINEYRRWHTVYINFKAMQFKADKFDYDKTSGRITLMSFERS